MRWGRPGSLPHRLGAPSLPISTALASSKQKHLEGSEATCPARHGQQGLCVRVSVPACAVEVILAFCKAFSGLTWPLARLHLDAAWHSRLPAVVAAGLHGRNMMD